MKAISIKQPWASLIINGYKEYEFRTWKTKYRGKILIHASQTIDKDIISKFKHLNIKYPTGCIIGEVNIIDCLKVDSKLDNKLKKENNLIYEENYIDYYAFKLNNIIKYNKPIKAKGQLGIWNYNK
ncbi:MAG: ASCH domain-containing protein [Bacilli bacterium]|nr:ASCH domain-containing protein [Bacilli bacterium]MDD4406954.1 ASCH domain-containing protein [Bacilli bacterium]